MHIIFGAAGKTGQAAALHLLSKQVPIRAVVRDADKAVSLQALGAEVAIADLDDPASCDAAFEGGTALYLFNPPAYQTVNLFDRAELVHDTLIEAATKAEIGHVVALSSVGAQHDRGTGNILTAHDLENRLLASQLSWTVLRAANFMENWAWVLDAVRNGDHLPSMLLPLNRAIPMVSVTDVGRTVADLMLAPADQRIVELHGPQVYSPNDAAAALTKLLGRPITAAAVPEERWVQLFVDQDMPQTTASAFAEMYRGFISGHVDFEGTHATQRGTVSLIDALRPLTQRLHHA